MAPTPQTLQAILRQTNFLLVDYWLQHGLLIQRPGRGHYFAKTIKDRDAFQFYWSPVSESVYLGVAWFYQASQEAVPIVAFMNKASLNPANAFIRIMYIQPDLSMFQQTYDYELNYNDEDKVVGQIPLQDRALRDIEILITAMNTAGQEFMRTYLASAGLEQDQILAPLRLPSAPPAAQG